VRIDTVQQDCRQLALDCFEMITQLVDDNEPTPLQRYLPATLQWRHTAD
jgi:LacI family sucrose operon transcriptional repressor